MDNSPLALSLASMRARITRVLPVQVRECLAQLSDEQIWWRPNESSNSVGNLVLHLSGSLNHYLNKLIGGLSYDRNREQEFAERKQIPRDELVAIFDDMVANADKTFDSLTLERLGDPSPEPRMYTLLIEDLLGILTHISTHTGQIIWITKLQTGGGLDDLWMKAHKEQGGWVKKKA